MNIDIVNSGSPKHALPAEQIDKGRKQVKDSVENMATEPQQKSIQPEELLSQIKSLTEDGVYSVRFENDESQQLIVKVVDSETDEVIRQIPPEELMELTKHLNELRGNLVDTIS